MFITNRKLETLRNRMADTLLSMGYEEENAMLWDRYRVTRKLDVHHRIHGPHIDSIFFENALKNINEGEAYYALESRLFDLVHLPIAAKKEEEKPEPRLYIDEARYNFFETLLCGMEFDYHTGRENSFGHINIVDWQNIRKNRFSFFRKWKGLKSDGFGWDLIVMLNCVPVVAVLLEPTKPGNAPCEDAYELMREQVAVSPEMQIYTLFVILSDGKQTLVGTTTDSFDDFKPWNSLDGDNVDSRDVLMPLKSMLQPERLTNIIYNFIRPLPVSDDLRHYIYMLADMHVFFAVDKAYKRINKDMNPVIGHVTFLEEEDDLTMSNMGGQADTALQLLYDRCMLDELNADYVIAILNHHPTAEDFDKINKIEGNVLLLASPEVTPAECELINIKCTHARVIHICQRLSRPQLLVPYGELIYTPSQFLITDL